MNTKQILKSVGAFLAGFLTVAILSTIMDAILEAIGVLPSAANPIPFTSGMYILALVYRTIFTILGGYITAYLAPLIQLDMFGCWRFLDFSLERLEQL